MNVYKNRLFIKILAVVAGGIIAGISVWYTTTLVEALIARERKIIGLVANAYKVIGSSDNPESQSFLFLEIIETNNSVPLMLTDGEGHISSHRNLIIPTGLNDQQQERFLEKELALMKAEYPPILIEVPGIRQYIYYRNSDLLTRLKYYPLVQLGVIGVFGVLAYLAFSSSRRAEQNRVWVGLAKETAHQLGTPLSSLMAWIEYFRADDRFATEEFVDEIAKDVEKLEIITNRFSQIGSIPMLAPEDLTALCQRLVDYMTRRTSRQVSMQVLSPQGPVSAPVNRALFEWVLDNLIKNAVDAMAGKGRITLELGHRPDGKVYIDITDTGKGMSKAQQARAFDAGFTTKKRGWGLGLTLSKRIMEQYHGGKLIIRRSEPGTGTTFRVLVKA